MIRWFLALRHWALSPQLIIIISKFCCPVGKAEVIFVNKAYWMCNVSLEMGSKKFWLKDETFRQQLSSGLVGSAISAAKHLIGAEYCSFEHAGGLSFLSLYLSYSVVRNPNRFESDWGRKVLSSDDPSTVTQSLTGPNQCLSLVLSRAF